MPCPYPSVRLWISARHARHGKDRSRNYSVQTIRGHSYRSHSQRRQYIPNIGGFFMPITSISLDDETFKIAQSMPNKSAFMRECLKRWYALETGTHIHPTKSPLCFPYSKRGVCSLCWPDGIPPLADWKYFMAYGLQGGDFPVKHLRKQIPEAKTPEFSIPKGWNRKEREKPGKITLWMRFKRIFE